MRCSNDFNWIMEMNSHIIIFLGLANQRIKCVNYYEELL